ncbi:MAG: ribonuclease P protein component [Deltaproteobacteria bacterium]|nr:ribonuclease P protein component [Deltaproteobacteria bacterium]
MVSKPYLSIRKNSDFLDLKNNGQKVWASSWMLISFMRANKPISELGISISKKAGNAVIRNKIKRWVRSEIAKYLKSKPLVQTKMTFFIKPMKSDFYKNMSFDTFLKAFNHGIKQLEKNRIFTKL